jgi:hypothetical protein
MRIHRTSAPLPTTPGSVDSTADRITRVAMERFVAMEGDHSRKGRRSRVMVPADPGMLLHMASPESRAQMVAQRSSADYFSQQVLETIRLHGDARADALRALFSEAGAFKGTGLVVKTAGAVAQVGRGSQQTPAAHISFAPSLCLQATPSADLSRLTPQQAEAIFRGAGVQPSHPVWQVLKDKGAADPAVQQELGRFLSKGVLLTGHLRQQGASTVEVPLEVNQVDSDLERVMRSEIEEALNAVTQEGKAWRNQAARLIERIAEHLGDLLAQERGYIDTISGLVEVLQKRNPEPTAADLQPFRAATHPQSRWNKLKRYLANAERQSFSDQSLKTAEAEAQRLVRHHTHKCEAIAQQIQAFGTPARSSSQLAHQITPSPATVVGTLGMVRGSASRRRLSGDLKEPDTSAFSSSSPTIQAPGATLSRDDSEIRSPARKRPKR